MKNRKKIMVFFFSCIVGMSSFYTFGDSSGIDNPAQDLEKREKSISIYIDQDLQVYPAESIKVNGTIFVPMRPIFDAFGATVEWYPNERSISAYKTLKSSETNTQKNTDKISASITDTSGSNTKEMQLEFIIDTPYAKVNDKIVYLDAVPFIKNGVTMLPLRLISESFGYDVQWDPSKNTVQIVTAQEKTPKIIDKKGKEGEIEDKKNQTLTYQYAINKGVRNNSSYINAQIGSERVVDANKDFFATPNTYIAKEILAKKNLDTQEKWSKMNLELIPQVISNNIKNQMDNITISKKEFNLAKKKEELVAEKLRLEQLKYDAGLSSKAALDAVMLEKDQSAANIASLEKALKGKYIELSASIGEDVSEYMDFECEVKIEAIDESLLETHITESIANDPYLWFAQQTTALKEYGLLTYDYNINYNLAGESYSSVNLDLSQARANEKEIAKNLRQVLLNRSNQLEQLEAAYESAKLNLDSAVQALSTAKTQYNSGLIISYQLDEINYNIKQIIFEMEKLQLQYSQMLTLYEVAYLYPEYASSGAS